jgi:hypothetical protein
VGRTAKKVWGAQVRDAPPPVVEGSTVMVFFVRTREPPGISSPGGHPASPLRQDGVNHTGYFHPANNDQYQPPFPSKILGNFKIPKFEGSSRKWKA